MRRAVLWSLVVVCCGCQRLPESLFETGLYAEDGKTISGELLAYTPRVAFFSDGAEKRRFARIPAGKQVDNSDPDNWVFPVGTQLWKEFKRDGVLVETRLIEKLEDGQWMGAAYVWNADGTAAKQAPEGGVANVNGTAHDVPAASDCGACHRSTGEWPLSFSAVQLDHAGSGLTLADLNAKGLLKSPPGAGLLSLPGDATAQAALAYLHANCGNCHHEKVKAPQPGKFGPPADFQLKLLVGELSGSVVDTGIYKDAVGIDATSQADVNGLKKRIVAGAPDQSVLFHRVNRRDANAQTPVQMPPPFASSELDDAGVALLRAWIQSL